jgi:hypothetical protein
LPVPWKSRLDKEVAGIAAAMELPMPFDPSVEL